MLRHAEQNPAPPSDGSIIGELYDARRVPGAYARRVVPTHRGYTTSFPAFENKPEQDRELANRMFTFAGLPSLVDCVTAEPGARPVPEMVSRSHTAGLLQLFETWEPELLDLMMAHLKTPSQKINKVSRLGWPSLVIPRDKTQRVLQLWSEMLEASPAMFKHGFFTINVRLQAEDRKKVRQYTFVNDRGDAYKADLNRMSWQIEVPKGSGQYYCPSRVRLVFNPPACNLFCQVLDSACVNWWHEQPVRHHNVYSQAGEMPIYGYMVAFDVKHMDRHTQPLSKFRYEHIGGRYAEVRAIMDQCPYLVPSDTHRNFFLLRALDSTTHHVQYGSGLSDVAVTQTDAIVCLFAAFLHEVLHYTRTDALRLALLGGPPEVRLKNSGDDNFVFGDKNRVLDFLKYARLYLEIEEEPELKFLGLVYSPERSRFELTATSYCANTYLNERHPGSQFRPYPIYGHLEKRRLFQNLGQPQSFPRLLEEEILVLESLGVRWRTFLDEGAAQEAEMRAANLLLPVNFVLGKTYLLTDEEKERIGAYTGLPTNVCADMMNYLLTGSSYERKFYG